MPKAKRASIAQRQRWERLRALQCVAQHTNPHRCRGYIQIHHCGTNAGGRKNHDKVIPLCKWLHDEIARLSLRVWQRTWGTEAELLEIINKMDGS